MARVTISKAIQLSGVSRSTFYTSYINKGRITVSTDNDNKKYIDTSELLRVFGELQQDNQTKQQNNTDKQPPVQDRTPESNNRKALITENEQLKQQLEEARRREDEFSAREQWYQGQISNLTDSIKLLEAPKNSRPWWKVWK